ncbi:MAG TPA: hypothetical protein VFO35_12740, partial [Steroidobacteraceae bacterium]|nr:hypothetical protein [Steroidobacteraceae bacterium]
MITNTASGTNIQEIAADIYRINTPVAIPGTPGFSFNQYLVVDDAPFLFHTGLRGLFPVVSAAIAAVIPLARLKYVGLSHFEADECGAINEFLAVAPDAVPVCGRVAAMTSVNDFATRRPRVLADKEDLDLGHHRIRWFDTPHVPHAWECGLAMDMTTRTFFCGDLFTQGGDGAGFNFNQYLVADEEPLLFHTGPRRLFPLVAEAVGKVLPLARLRYLAFSHFEADECG